MSFFDNKEEVIKIELTPYGKKILLEGNFQPVYYSFHDDGVIYDITSAQADDEIQLSSSLRILEQSVFLKPQTKYDKNNTVITENNTIQNLLGNSSINKDSMPSWNVEVIKGTINSFQEKYKNTDQVEQKKLSPIFYNLDIPQINLREIYYDITVLGISDEKKENDIIFDDNNALRLNKNYALLDISELNVDIEDEAFSVELFEVVDPLADGTENLKQVFFKKPLEYVVNDILLDESQVKEQIVDENLETADIYLNLLVDEEIDLQRISNEVGKILIPKIPKPPFGEIC